MVESDKLEAPQGNPLFGVNFRAISESLAGWGVVSNGDFRVSAGSGGLEIDVDSGVMFSGGEEYEHGSPTTKTLSAGDGSNDRWDTVYFDTAASDDSVSPSVGVHEGTPGQYPEPPDVTGDEVLLALVYVPSGAADIASESILNWITHCQTSGGVYIEDSSELYDSVDLEGVFGEIETRFEDIESEIASRTGDTASVTDDYTTDGESVIFVDTATTESAVTITLATSDLGDGVDLSVIDTGGGASGYPITVTTEGTEQIDASDVVMIDRDYGAESFTSDGAEWWTVGGSDGATGSANESDEVSFDWSETGSVKRGDSALLNNDQIGNGETINVRKATLTTETASAVSEGVDLKLVTFDGGGGFTERGVILSGDGSSIYDGETGSPLYSYTNDSGAKQTVGVVVDNSSGDVATVVASVAAGEGVNVSEVEVQNEVDMPFYGYSAFESERFRPPLSGKGILGTDEDYATLDTEIDGVSLPSMDSSVSANERRGVLVEPNVDTGAFEVDLGGVGTDNDLFVVDNSDGTVIASTEVEFSDPTTIVGPFDSGQRVRVVVGSGGSGYTCDSSGDESYPYTSDTVDVVSGVNGGTITDSSRFAVEAVRTKRVAEVGNCKIVAGASDAIAEWDAVLVRGEENSGNITAHLVEVDDSGTVQRFIETNIPKTANIGNISTDVNLGLLVKMAPGPYTERQPVVYSMAFRWIVGEANRRSTYTESVVWEGANEWDQSEEIREIAYPTGALEPSDSAVTEDFESTPLEFDFSGDWELVTDPVDSDNQVYASEEIGDSTQATTSFSRTFEFDSVMKFDYRVSSEAYDDFEVRVGNNYILDKSGKRDWESDEHEISKGEHTFRFNYDKNYDGSAGEDRAYIDNLSFEYVAGRLLTATKTFEKTVTPNLYDLQYELNDGDITLTVIGSPGEFEEERIEKSLKGDDFYPLVWKYRHTTFQIEVRMDTSLSGVDPSMSRIELLE